ncbi:MAG: DNA (cytosine-5-)-methyltransferase [Erythrobacter sp.]|nr:DNA (cytosine-5-)-methyltransferase [Erythrobacter sp.]
MTSANNSIEAVDLFCGIGGLSLGLEQSGIPVKLGVDIDGRCRYPFEHNISGAFLECDVSKLTVDQVASSYDGASIKVLAGCAPCQPFSTYRRSSKGLAKPSEWSLVERFGELIVSLQPDLVTMENVPPLADQPVFTSLLAALQGYHVDWDIIELQRLGLAQTRKRLVLVASRLGPIELDLPHGDRATVRDTIGGLPAIGAGEASPDDPMHRSSKLSPLNLKRIRASKPGGTWRDWPEELRSACHRKQSGDTFPSVYGRMAWDSPSPTITTQCFGYGNGRFGHPKQDRAISLREAAMLQGFPRDYEFLPRGGTPDFASYGRLIGNAVPVPLGRAIGELFKRHVAALTDQNSHPSATTPS